MSALLRTVVDIIGFYGTMYRLMERFKLYNFLLYTKTCVRIRDSFFCEVFLTPLR